jgi:IclR family transcriptional regulator, acetate operon repressor
MVREVEVDGGDMAGNAADQGRTVTAKLAAILTSFTAGSVQQLTELARHSGLPVSTTHRLAAELTATDFLQRSSAGGFRIGPALRDLTDPTPRPPTLVERAPHVVEDLVEALHLPTRLGVLHGLEVGYIEKAPGHIPVTSFSPAARRPAHATALGKALLAFAPPDVLRRIGTASLTSFTARTLTRPDQLHRALHRVRCDGRALDRGELSAHVRTVAVPVLGPGDIALAAVEVEVDDLSAGTIATVTPVLTLAAHGLMRELHPSWRRSPRARHASSDGVAQESAG